MDMPPQIASTRFISVSSRKDWLGWRPIINALFVPEKAKKGRDKS